MHISTEKIPKLNSVAISRKYVKKLNKIEKQKGIPFKSISELRKIIEGWNIGHFVLVFKFIQSENKIIFVDFDHHDNIYGWFLLIYTN